MAERAQAPRARITHGPRISDRTGFVGFRATLSSYRSVFYLFEEFALCCESLKLKNTSEYTYVLPTMVRACFDFCSTIKFHVIEDPVLAFVFRAVQARRGRPVHPPTQSLEWQTSPDDSFYYL